MNSNKALIIVSFLLLIGAINKTNTINGWPNILPPIPPAKSEQPYLVPPTLSSLSNNVNNSISFYSGNSYP